MAKEFKPKLYPLTSAQRMHFLTVKYCPKKEVLNIGTNLVIQDDIDFDLLRETIKRCYAAFDSMRLRFCTDKKGNLFQYVAPEETREIEFFDFSHWRPEDAAAKMREWTAVPFETENSPMNRIVMISMPEGYKGLYLCVDHRTMDSYSIITFMKHLIEIYCALKFDTPYPDPLEPYEKQLVKDLSYEENSPAQRRDREYWDSIFSQPEPIFTDINFPHLLDLQRKESGDPGRRAASFADGRVDANIKGFRLEPDPSRRLVLFCEQNKVSMVCLLMMGVRTYLSKLNGNEKDVSVKTTVSRRGTLLEKRSGGTRIHFFPCRTIVEEYDSFLEGVFKIRDSQNAIFRHANANPVELLARRSELYKTAQNVGYESMSLTYQPASMRSNSPELDNIRYKCEWITNGAAANPLYLTVMHNSVDNGLDFFFEYQQGHVTDKQLEEFYYYLCKILFMGVQEPDISVGEILRTV